MPATHRPVEERFFPFTDRLTSFQLTLEGALVGALARYPSSKTFKRIDTHNTALSSVLPMMDS